MRIYIAVIAVSFAVGLLNSQLFRFTYTDFEFYVSHALFYCPCVPARELSQKNLEKYRLEGMTNTQILGLLGQPDNIVDAPGLPHEVWFYEKLNICAWVLNGKCTKMRALHVYWH